MASALGLEVSCEVASFLGLEGLLSLGACGRSMHRMATGAADGHMRACFAGVQPRAGSDRAPFWRAMCEAVRPVLLHYTYCGPAPDCTRLLNMVLDSAGTWFVEFEMTTAKAPSSKRFPNVRNGAPCVGLVEASARLTAQQRESGKVPWDMSRSRLGDLGISFNPECGQVFASGLEVTRSAGMVAGAETWRTARVKWDPIDNLSTLRAGFLLDAGKLSFFRGNQWGAWCSSRPVFGNLPGQVVPAVFLSSFVGYASVRFLDLRSSPPPSCDTCAQCDALAHGLHVAWQTSE